MVPDILPLTPVCTCALDILGIVNPEIIVLEIKYFGAGGVTMTGGVTTEGGVIIGGSVNLLQEKIKNVPKKMATLFIN
jgi:hypothetical protein